MFFLMDHSSRYVYAGQEDKDKGLDGCGEDGDRHEREGEEERNDRSDNQYQEFFSKDIPEETNRERDRTGEMADDLDRDEERCEKRGGARKMFEIFQYTLGFDPLPVVVDKDRERAPYGHVDLAGRGHKPGNKTEKVAEEDKEPDCGDHRQVFLSLFSGDFTQEVFEKLDDELEDALTFRRDDLEITRGQTEKEDEGQCHKKDHYDVVRKEMFRVLDFDPKKREEGSNRFPEDLIEEVN